MNSGEARGESGKLRVWVMSYEWRMGYGFHLAVDRHLTTASFASVWPALPTGQAGYRQAGL